MSALAQILLAVTRPSRFPALMLNDSPLLQTLRDAGAQVFLGHDAKALDAAPPDAIIWGSAIAAR